MSESAESAEIMLTRLKLAEGAEISRVTRDAVAVEEPLEIRVEGRSLAVVMRTPGHDDELAAGFLLSENVIRSRRDIFEISQCPSQSTDEEGASKGNVVDVLLADASGIDWESLTRHVFSASSCGICGKATIDSVIGRIDPLGADLGERIPARVIAGLPDKLREAQRTFRTTGGLHASALFDREGSLRLLREDVGRHNALDKVIGHSLLHGSLPLSDTLLLLSGRVSFELMQKAHAAGIPVVAAISAPSSLAVDFAQESGQTLIGFLRGETMNVYAGVARLRGEAG